jgi:hypothetical protein
MLQFLCFLLLTLLLLHYSFFFQESDADRAERMAKIRNRQPTSFIPNGASAGASTFCSMKCFLGFCWLFLISYLSEHSKEWILIIMVYLADVCPHFVCCLKTGHMFSFLRARARGMEMKRVAERQMLIRRRGERSSGIGSQHKSYGKAAAASCQLPVILIVGVFVFVFQFTVQFKVHSTCAYSSYS